MILTSSAAGGAGHASHYLDRMAQGLTSLGLEVMIVTPLDYAPAIDLEKLGVSILRVSARASVLRMDQFRAWGRFAGLARGISRMAVSRAVLGEAIAIARPGDLVHFIDYEYLTLIRALRALNKAGVAVAVTFHPADFDGSTGGLGAVYKRSLRALLARVVRDVDLLVCHGPWIAERLKEQLEIQDPPHGPRFLCPYYPSDGYGSGSLRDAPVMNSGSINVLWFGMIRRNKRLEMGIAAVALLPDSIRLHVSGHPTEVSTDEVLKWVEEAGLDDRVELTLRYLTEEEADQAFREADILLATHETTFTSASGPLADARCYGLPVVVPKAGQLAEYVIAEDVGVVAGRDDPHAFAEAVTSAARRLAASPSWSQQILETARRWSWEEFVRQHLEAYRAVVDTGDGEASGR